ncbi:hypothetical protein ABZW11_13005 [Nonomuraea sp. NPDC004580]|uniref:hypothetical protein n=1 Tax=Nonomuraea sp. NPDC004580 TaxID=3154552 RepID=UPI0033AEE11A
MSITRTEPAADDVEEFELDIEISVLPEGTQPVGRHTHWWTCAPCVTVTSWPSRCC